MRDCRFLSLLLFCFVAVPVFVIAQTGLKQQKDNKIEIEKFSVLSDSLPNAVDVQRLLKPDRKATDRQGEKPFVTVEQMPSFPGGESKMMNFLSDQIRLMMDSIEVQPLFRISVRFVVEANGDLTDIKVFRKSYHACNDRASVKMIEAMPKWIPGRQNGVPVPVYYTISGHWHFKE